MWLQPSLNSGRHLYFYLTDLILMIWFPLISTSAENGILFSNLSSKPPPRLTPNAPASRDEATTNGCTSLLWLSSASNSVCVLLALMIPIISMVTLWTAAL